MEQARLRRRIRGPRRVTVLLTTTAVSLGASTTATAAQLSQSVFEPSAIARADAPCAPAPVPGVEMSEGLPTPPGRVRSTGVLNALNLMIDFPDARGEGTARARFREFFPQTAEWYRAGSYGALDYRAHAPVQRWLRMPRTFASYGIKRGSPYAPGYRQLVQDIVKAADARVDFRKYDLVNVLVTPNAGPPAVDTVLSVTYSGIRNVPRADGVPLSNVSFVYSRQDDGTPAAHRNAYRVLPHENAHAFGIPDLYTADGGTKAGHWDVMSEDWGAGNDFLGWHKHKLGWLGGGRFACATGHGDSVHRLAPLARPDGTKLLYVPVSGSTGWAVEVRTRAGNDHAVCKPGVLVYWVDAGVDSGRGPVTVADSEPDSGGCAQEANANAELTDATFGVDEQFSDQRTGVSIAVTGRTSDGTHTVRVTRP